MVTGLERDDWVEVTYQGRYLWTATDGVHGVEDAHGGMRSTPADARIERVERPVQIGDVIRFADGERVPPLTVGVDGGGNGWQRGVNGGWWCAGSPGEHEPAGELTVVWVPEATP